MRIKTLFKIQNPLHFKIFSLGAREEEAQESIEESVTMYNTYVDTVAWYAALCPDEAADADDDMMLL